MRGFLFCAETAKRLNSTHRSAICAGLQLCFCCKLQPMRVMGIDCGGEYTGYGIVDQLPDTELRCVCVGAIQLSPRDRLELRLKTIFERLTALMLEHRPEVVAIEDVFYAVNAKS